MTRKFAAIALVVVAIIFAAIALNLPRLFHKRDTTHDSDEQQLKELLRQWDEAYARRDGPALAHILADDFVFTTARGILISRAMYLSANLKSPDIAVETPVGSEDVKIKLYGNTAVMTSRAAQRGQRFDRDPLVRFLYTDVWVKREGRWQAVASQATRVAPGPL